MAQTHTPAVGSAERKEIMNVLRELPVVTKHATDAGEPMVFQVNRLLVDQRSAIAKVVPATTDGKKTYAPILAFLRRGGDEPWFVEKSGAPSEAWVEAYISEKGNEDFKAMWLPQPAPKPSDKKITTLKKGDLPYSAIEKVILALPLLKDRQRELGKPILLAEVELKSSGNWAWFVAQPRTADKSWQGESLIYLLECKNDKWSVSTSIPEEVMTADDSEKAYQKWRSSLLKKHTDLPAALVPKN